MQVKLRDVLDAVEALRFLGEQALPAAVSFRVTKVMKAVDEHIATYQQVAGKVQQRFVTERAALGAEPSQEAVTALLNSCNTEIETLLNEVISLPGEPIIFTAFSHVNIPPNHLLRLHWLLREPEVREVPPAAAKDMPS